MTRERTTKHAGRETTVRDLRSFGFVTGAVSIGLFGLLLPLLRGSSWPLWPWIVAAPLVLLAIIAPRTLRGAHAIWMRIGHVLGAINTRIILGILFFLVFVPMGLILRLLGKNPLARQFDPDAKSYRIPVNHDASSSMEHPF